MSILKKLVVFLICCSAISSYAIPQYSLEKNKILINGNTSLTINLSGTELYKFSQGFGYNVIDPTTNSIVKTETTAVNGAKDIVLQLNDLPAGHYVQLYTDTFLGRDKYMNIGNITEESQTLSFLWGYGIEYTMSITENGTFGSPVPSSFVALLICGAVAGILWVRQRRNKNLLVSSI